MSPTRISGRYHSTKGAIKQNFGKVVGWHALEMRGATERTAGNAQVTAARTKGWTEATGSRIAGKSDQVVGAITGNRSQQLSGNLKRDKGDFVQGVSRKV